MDDLVERLKQVDFFVNDPVSLKPRRRNPDGPEAAAAITTLRDKLAASEARIAELEVENAWLREALVKEREEKLWMAYGQGYESYGRWTHMRMADGEWLARECGFDPALPDYDADEIKAAIPKAARKVLAIKGD